MADTEALNWNAIAFVDKEKPRKVADILAATALHFGVTLVDLKSPSHAHRISHPRQIAMYLARDMTTASFPQIGRIVGNRHHTTAMFACRKIAKLLAEGHEATRKGVEAVRDLASTGNPTAAYRAAIQAARYAEEERLATIEAEQAIAHAIRMKQLRSVRQRAEAGFVPELERAQ